MDDVVGYEAALKSPNCYLVVHLKNKEKLTGKFVTNNSDFMIIRETDDDPPNNVFHTIPVDSILYFSVF